MLAKLQSYNIDSANRCLRDIVALSTLPAMWSGAEPLRIAEILAASLYSALSPKLVFVSFCGTPELPEAAVAQTGRARTDPALAAALGPVIRDWALSHDPDDLLCLPESDGSMLRCTAQAIGHHAELGVIAAGFTDDEPPFPGHQLLLNVATTQAAIAVQNSRLLRSLRENEAQVRVANEELAKRIAELQRLNSELQESRRSALNLMEEAVKSQQLVQSLNRELKSEVIDRTKKEETLRHRSAQFETLFTRAPLAVYLVDSELRILEVNPVAAPMLASFEQELTGRPLREVLRERWSEEIVDHTIEVFRRTLDTGEPYVQSDFVGIRIDRSGEERFEWRVDRITLPDGSYGVVCYARDTELELKARTVMAESEERFRTLVSVITDVPWTSSPDGAFVTEQHPWGSYTGQSWEEHREFGWLNALHPEDRERNVPLWREACRSGKPYRGRARLWHAASRQYRHCDAKAVPVCDAQGQVREWVGAFTDVEEQVRLAEARTAMLESERAARAEAERAGRMKDEFLATLSHELRTPLNAILGYSTVMMMSRMPPEEVQNIAKIIERNARVQAQLIEDLLDMNRIISGKVRLNMEPLNLAELIAAAVNTVQQSAETKGVTIVLSLASEPILVRGDPDRIQQVIWNLISNAVKFTPEGGKVQVTLRRNEAEAAVAVADTGAGIKPEFLPHVFDRFRQADGSTTRSHGGLGLGLAIAKHLVDLHGGLISATSEGEQRGATFTVVLPLLQEECAAETDGRLDLAPAAHVRGADYDFSRLRVLVVDDQPDAAGLLRRVLEEYRASVAEANSVQQALTLLSSDRFDLLISDIGMPGEDGYQLLEHLRSSPNGNAAIPAIAVTAFARPQDRRRAAQAGFQTHIAKPIEPNQLLGTVAALTDRVRD